MTWPTDRRYDILPEFDEDESLLNVTNFVHEYGKDPNVVDAEPGFPPGPDDREVRAAYAGYLEVDIPDDFVAGMIVTAWSACGPVRVSPHPDEKPGSHIQIPLRPQPEFKVEVPPGKKGGETVHFRREDGTSITMDVPEGMCPGDTFNVAAPCLVVRVPRDVEEGTSVLFHVEDKKWWRATVPSKGTLRLNQFFFARLPEDLPEH